MLTPDRRELLLDELRDKGSVRVSDLVETLGVSDVTIRRDIEALVQQGLAERFHGGATLPKGRGEPPVYRTGPGGATGTQGVPQGLPLSGTDHSSSAPLRVGVLLPGGGYFREVLVGIGSAVARANARQVFALSRYEPERDLASVKALIRDGVDGLLLASASSPGTSYTEFADELRALEVPVVLLERRLDPSVLIDRLDHVVSDHDTGARLAVEHLAGLGHRRIALVSKTVGPTAPHIAAGYAYAVEVLGLAADLPVFEVPQMDQIEQGSDHLFGEVVTQLRAQGVTAALVHGDAEALALEQLVLERGIRVPEDLALVSYDDEMAAYASVPLTAVCPPRQLIGWTGVELLIRRIRLGENRPVQHTLLQPSLVVRDSCGARTR